VGRTGLEACWARLGEPVKVSATISLASAVRLDILAPRLGLSRSAAIREAIDVRTLVWEQVASRRQRHVVDRLLRDAERWAPVDELLAQARLAGATDL
jgi:predicted transcriptional regulator